MTCPDVGMNGANILIYIDGELVGSQRNVVFAQANDEIDVSSKEARGKRVLAGRYSATINLDALYVPTDAGYLALQAAVRNGTKVEVWREEDGGVLESACAIVTALSEAGPDQAECTMSCTLVVDGDWTSGS